MFKFFASYSWGTEPEYSHQKIVQRIIDEVSRDGDMPCWLDTELMSTNNDSSRRNMSNAMDSSSIFVCFVDKMYYDKVNGDNDVNGCWFEVGI